MINSFIMLLLNFFQETKNGGLWRDIRDGKILREEYLSL